jgi:hypothetical protein
MISGRERSLCTSRTLPLRSSPERRVFRFRPSPERRASRSCLRSFSCRCAATITCSLLVIVLFSFNTLRRISGRRAFNIRHARFSLKSSLRRSSFNSSTIVAASYTDSMSFYTRVFSPKLTSVMRFAESATKLFAHARYVFYVVGLSFFPTYILKAFPLRYIAASSILLSLSPLTAVKYVL